MSVQLGEWRDGKLYIESLEYEFPKKPAKKDMINYGIPPRMQYWSRITEYEKYDWSEGWEERMDTEHEDHNPEQLEYLYNEVKRIVEGVWIFIQGEEVYMNGDMYFFCQWYLLEDGTYPNFRDSALYYYRFIEICDKHPLCTGHTLLKARRLGATAMTLSRLQRQLLTNTDSNFGIVSNKGKNANKAFQRVVKSMGNLPVFLKPTQEGNTAPKQVLSLKEQAQRITKTKKQGAGQKGLNNELSWENTDLNSYDSYALKGLLLDEVGKYPKEVPFSKYLAIVTKCLKKGSKVVGKLMAPTTCNPPADGGSEYRAVYESSDQTKRGDLGQTNTGLYRVFIPAYIGFEGYILKSGKSVWQTPTPEESKELAEMGCEHPHIGAKEFLEKQRKQLENTPEDLQEEIRMNPFTAEEVFETANDRCIFNIQHLNQRENELTDKLVDLGRDTKKGELGRIGWFHRQPNGKVIFIDDPKGLWYVHQFPRLGEENKYRDTPTGIEPLNESYGAAGLDPVQSGQVTVDKGSDCSCIIHRRYSSADEINSDIPVALFIGRMENIDEMYQQIYNGLIYYGVKMLGERAPDYFVKYAKDHGLENYLYGTVRADGSEVKGIVAQQTLNVKDEHARVQVMKARDCWYKIPFIRLIRDMKQFSVKNRTDWDCCMSWGYALMACEYPIKKTNTSKINFSSWLQVGKITTYR